MYLKEENMLDVIYEDNHIIVVIKPQNVPSQSDQSNDPDMIFFVKKYLKEKYDKQGNVYVGLVHRLDRPTGGIMIFAKTSKASSRLCDAIRCKNIKREYLSVCMGAPKQDSARLTHFLKKNMKNNMVSVVTQSEINAKVAELDYEVVNTKDKLSLIKINLITGRSHQIRVQLKQIGCPIWGDAKYNIDNYKKGQKISLWCYNIVFTHPTTKKEMNFKVFPDIEDYPWNEFNYSKL